MPLLILGVLRGFVVHNRFNAVAVQKTARRAGMGFCGTVPQDG